MPVRSPLRAKAGPRGPSVANSFTAEALVQMAYRGAADGFRIHGLGKLVKVDRKARMGRNKLPPQ